ncbi:penicillin-binding protein 2A [Kroppenstedtia guangzhouensis]|uniref:Penicillin-binding protein 2A n=1 Tax=Kroppenstedtia guangzhouensis TaxID=1274356 RepID=A0ABQ1G7C7_9BACL|nr:PBP1A family penicillin-binding protein [Kroppenstedtia guangzhouensis]GGA38140.1 penicillin-binding protein 2A [Kroppenstedtia guangzhouensis]
MKAKRKNSLKDVVAAWWRRAWVRKTVWTLTALILLFIITFNILVGTRDVSALDRAAPQPTVIIDQNGEVASRISASKTEAVGMKEIPTHMVQAVVAIEDHRFYSHSGVDYWGSLRAAVTNLKAGHTVQGGSTLTQQLAKNVFLTHERTYKRKIKEVLLAKKIERSYTKDEIMEMYLNTIYFGEGAWGLKKAARTYFGKEPEDLTVGESALLAGMIQAPSALSPFKNFNKAMTRRDVVLSKMVTEGFIDEKTAQKAKETDIVLEGQESDDYKGRYPSYVDAIIQEAIDRYGLTEKEVLSGGLRIYTELDPRMQQAAEKVYARDDLFPQGKGDTLVQSGSVLVDPRTGGIRALVGGRGEHVFRGFNRATQLKRQPGSTMKPISVYAPALIQGYDLNARLVDRPISFGNYAPKNQSQQYLGEVTMYEAVIDSLNVPAVWLLDQIGVDKGYRYAKTSGIALTDDDRQLALALGGLQEGVSPLQMAQAYSAFANNGIVVDAHAIRRVETVDGEVLGKWYKKSVRVSQPVVAQQITYMLRGVVQEGTGRKAQIPGRPTAGKTGTTQLPDGRDGAKDNWFVGYTPELVGAVWIGYDKTDANHYLTTSSGSTAAPVFRELMTGALRGRPVKEFDLSSVKWKTPPKIDRTPPEEERKEKDEGKEEDRERGKLGDQLKKEWEKRKEKIENELKKKRKEWEEKWNEWKN